MAKKKKKAPHPKSVSWKTHRDAIGRLKKKIAGLEVEIEAGKQELDQHFDAVEIACENGSDYRQTIENMAKEIERLNGLLFKPQ